MQSGRSRSWLAAIPAAQASPAALEEPPPLGHLLWREISSSVVASMRYFPCPLMKSSAGVACEAATCSCVQISTGLHSPTFLGLFTHTALLDRTANQLLLLLYTTTDCGPFPAQIWWWEFETQTLRALVFCSTHTITSKEIRGFRHSWENSSKLRQRSWFRHALSRHHLRLYCITASHALKETIYHEVL